MFYCGTLLYIKIFFYLTVYFKSISHYRVFFYIFLKTFLRYKFTVFKFEKRHLNSLSVLKMIKLTTKQLLKIAYHCVSPSYVELSLFRIPYHCVQLYFIVSRIYVAAMHAMLLVVVDLAKKKLLNEPDIETTLNPIP